MNTRNIRARLTAIAVSMLLIASMFPVGSYGLEPTSAKFTAGQVGEDSSFLASREDDSPEADSPRLRAYGIRFLDEAQQEPENSKRERATIQAEIEKTLSSGDERVTVDDVSEMLGDRGAFTSVEDGPQTTDPSTGLVYTQHETVYITDENDTVLATLDGSGCSCVIGYAGGHGTQVSIPATLGGEEVAYVSFNTTLSSVTAIDLSNASWLGALLVDADVNPGVSISSLDLSACTHLKVLQCEGQNLASLDISSNYKLQHLFCRYNRIAETAALRRWLSVSGHNGVVLPQNPQGSSYSLPTQVDQEIVLNIPNSVNGVPIPIVGGLRTTLDLSSVPAFSKVLDDGTFRIAIGTINGVSVFDDAMWESFKSYVMLDQPTEAEAGIVAGQLQSDNFTGSSGILDGEGAISFGLSGSLYGFIEGEIRDGAAIAYSSHGLLTLSRGYEFEHMFNPTAIPCGVLLRVNFDISLAVSGGIEIAEGGAFRVGVNGAEVVFPNVRASVGAALGMANLSVADASVYGSFAEHIRIPPPNSSGTTGYSAGEMGLSLSALGFTYSYAILKGTWPWDTRTDANSLNGTDGVLAEGGGPSESPVSDEYRRLAAGGEVGESSFSSDPSLESPSQWLGSAVPSSREGSLRAAASEPATIVETGSFNDVQPRLAITSSGKQVLVWTTVVQGRTAPNNTAVVYSMRQGSSGAWSAPAIVDDDGSADFYPSVVSCDDTVWIAWTNSNDDSLAASSTLSDVAETCETEIASLDAVTGLVTLHGQTNDSVADVRPSIAVVQGEPVIAWQRNSANDLLSLSGTNSVMRGRIVNGALVASSVASSASPLWGAAAGSMGGDELVAWVAQGEGGSSVLKCADGLNAVSAVATAASGSALCSPHFASIGGDDVLAWYQNGELWSWDGSGSSALGAISSADFRIASFGGSDYVVSFGPRGEEDGLTALFASPVEGGQLGAGRYIAKQDSYIRAFDVAVQNGSLVAAFAESEVQIGFSSVSEDTSLVVTGTAGGADLSIDGVDYDSRLAAAGESLDVAITVSNNGLEAVSSVSVALASGSSSQAATFACNLQPGETEVFEAEVQLASDLAQYPNVEASVYPVGVTEGDDSDNETEFRVAYSDLTIMVDRLENGDLRCRVRNVGATAATAFFKVSAEDGAPLTTTYIGSMPSYAGVVFTIGTAQLAAWADSGDTLTFEAFAPTDSERYLHNNRTDVRLSGAVCELGGNTRVSTAALMAATAFPEGADAVILAEATSYPDQIVASSLAAVREAPLLFTSNGAVPSATQAALSSLLGEASTSKTVYLVGSARTAAAAIEQLGYSTASVYGNTRLNTAVAAYQSAVGDWGDTAVVVYGYKEFDAMSIAPFLHGEKAPVFLTAETSRELSANAVSAIVQGGFERVVLVGGPNAVATTVPTQLTNAGYEGTVERLAGNTRYATNAAVARWLVSDCGYSYNGMAIGSSEGFSDAFAGAGVCGKEKSVLLLVNGDAAPAGLTAITNVVANDARAANVLKIYFFGKTNAVPSELRSRALSALGWL